MRTYIVRPASILIALFAAGFLLKSLGVAEIVSRASGNSNSHLTFTTEDGLILNVWKSEAVGPSDTTAKRPGLALLLPMMSKTHESYDPLIRGLNDLGYSTLAFDLRGHGLSTRVGPDSLSYADMKDDQFVEIPNDVDLFFRYFRSTHQGEYDYANVIIVGASIGANTAGLLLGQDWVTRAVLLSPGRDYRGLRPETVMASPDTEPTKPIYLAVSTNDTYSAESSQWLFDNYHAPKVLKKYPGQNHGTNIFLNVKGADAELFDWLSK
jgi:alpha-beta hydrolase superfamily lysophospholipase